MQSSWSPNSHKFGTCSADEDPDQAGGLERWPPIITPNRTLNKAAQHSGMSLSLAKLTSLDAKLTSLLAVGTGCTSWCLCGHVGGISQHYSHHSGRRMQYCDGQCEWRGEPSTSTELHTLNAAALKEFIWLNISCCECFLGFLVFCDCRASAGRLEWKHKEDKLWPHSSTPSRSFSASFCPLTSINVMVHQRRGLCHRAVPRYLSDYS